MWHRAGGTGTGAGRMSAVRHAGHEMRWQGPNGWRSLPWHEAGGHGATGPGATGHGACCGTSGHAPARPAETGIGLYL